MKWFMGQNFEGNSIRGDWNVKWNLAERIYFTGFEYILGNYKVFEKLLIIAFNFFLYLR